MRYRLGSIQVRHEARFKAPFFPIVDSRADLLQRLYRALGVKYGARAPDIHFTAIGAALSDLRATINLFRGLGKIEVSAEKVSASFSNALESDLQIIVDCVKRSLAAVESFSEAGELIDNEYASASAVMLFDNEIQRDAVLSGLSKASANVPAELAPEVRPVYKIELHHPSENWIVLMELARAWGESNGLLLTVTANFLSGGGAQQIEQRVSQLNGLCLGALRSLGLEPQPQQG